ncbi:MAG UNVERIFIED_CONTAM: SEC-C domain-containing protein [Planctomycetaceae bacterium]
MELSSDTADQSLYILLDATIVTLIQLGDSQILADLSGDPRLGHESLLASASLLKGLHNIGGGIASCVTAFAMDWFMNKRFMSTANTVQKLVTHEMSSLYASDPEDSDPSDTPANSDPLSGHPSRKTTNVGRNDPCPCGSGRKYKKCCGDQ